jgi:hypothetical protein
MENSMVEQQSDVLFRSTVLSAQSESAYLVTQVHIGGISQAISNYTSYISQYMFCCLSSDFVLVDS